MLEEAKRQNEEIDRRLEEKYEKQSGIKKEIKNNKKKKKSDKVEGNKSTKKLAPSKKEIKQKKANKKQMKSDNKEFARIMYFFVSVFLCMMGYLVYFQLSLSADIINSSYNTRQDLLAKSIVRGKIMDSQGNILAQTIGNDEGIEKRDYPMGELYSHIVGYDVMGKSGVELSNNFTLLTSNSFFGEKIMNEVTDTKHQGDNVITTLNTSMQKAAYESLGNYNGAVVVIEPSTGKILTMVSKTSFDPTFESRSWESITSSSESILLNRATNGLYIPGSIFKIVTTLDYMRTNTNYRDFSYTCKGFIEYGDTKIQCAGGKSHGQQNLAQAFANSCNGAFIEMGLSLDLNSYKSTAKDLLFNTQLPGVFNHKKSQFDLDTSSDQTKIMMTAMGQGDTQVTPLHMALIASAIANDGKLMEPYVVDYIENNTGSIVKKYNTNVYGKLMSVHEATQLSEYMEAVVNSGTATELKTISQGVAGKTGTAEDSSDKNENHSWFIGFSDSNNPDLAISVVVEESNGGLKASTVAKNVIEAFYK